MFLILCECVLVLDLFFYGKLVVSTEIVLQENDICDIDKINNRLFVCKRLDGCPSAIADVQNGIYPRLCAFQENEVIVCCQQNQLEKLLPYKTKDYWISDPDADDDSVKFTMANVNVELDYEEDPIKFQVPIKTESKSEQMCKEYEEAACKLKPFTPNLIVEIVGGAAALPKQYPHMAAIGFGDQPYTKWNCGGSLISDRFVLSAAHCATSYYDGEARWIRLGDLDLNSVDDDENAADFEIIERIIYPEYNSSSMYNDIALFKLKEIVEFSLYIRPICLNWRHNFDKLMPVIAIGWEQTNIGETKSSTLLSVELNIIPYDQCSTMYGISDQFVEGINRKSMICAGDPGGRKDTTCQGDSGGPLQHEIVNKKCANNMITYSQIGITSFGRSCAQPDSPGVYTNVYNYLPWIENVVWKY